jgi:ribosome-associated protein
VTGDPGRGPDVVRLRDVSIRLGQFLKLADLVDTGADAKGLLARGLVRVNGNVETRRGRQLVSGDVVECAGRRVVVASDA